MIKLVLFDVDGTLLHTLGAIKSGGDRALERYGHPTLPYEKYRDFIGDGPQVLMERAFGYYGDTDEKHIASGVKIYVDHLSRNYNTGVEAFPGMYDSVRDIKEMGMKIAVLSNKDQKAAEGNIQRYFGLELFDRIVAFKDGFAKKPAPDEALKLAEEFGAKPEECVMIGDSQPDILTAKNAGMKSIAVLWGYRTKEELEPCQPDVFVQTHEELPGIIKRWCLE